MQAEPQLASVSPSPSQDEVGGGCLKGLVDDDTLMASSHENDSDDSNSLSGNEAEGGNRRKNEGFRFRVRGIKRLMKTLMKRHGGSTRHPRVNKMIQKLEKMNPTHQPAKSNLLIGDFIAHSSPDFPGRIRPRRSSKRGNDQGGDDDQVVQYALGRLSFGIFEPHNLVCTVRAVRNSIQVCDDEELLRKEIYGSDGSDEEIRSFFYPIIIDLTIHTPQGIDLHAEMRHDALCHEIPGNDKRLGVTFLGGSLRPVHSVLDNPELMAVWKETFANAYKKADEERSYVSSILRFMVKWWLQLSLPSDEDAEKNAMHCVRYEMKRRPKGHLDVLYLDEELRVTRGNRGTLIVVERLPYNHDVEGPPPNSSLSNSPPFLHTE
ncbi:PAP_fibrillin [Seminavis robusta]|uniref:PAP_fibrillin n=1 Tax=Seminavis robusta TaxID=568900 RepID=A0A9N8EI15_9STRA|nr:PAP_fibrillin [Seminavis robusta]|eukprot:Sro1024_g232700.1 PAP_fibrillin (377) ;mRNA; r:29966-31096